MGADLKTPHKNYVTLFPSALNIPSEAAAATDADAKQMSIWCRVVDLMPCASIFQLSPEEERVPRSLSWHKFFSTQCSPPVSDFVFMFPLALLFLHLQLCDTICVCLFWYFQKWSWVRCCQGGGSAGRSLSWYKFSRDCFFCSLHIASSQQRDVDFFLMDFFCLSNDLLILDGRLKNT